MDFWAAGLEGCLLFISADGGLTRLAISAAFCDLSGRRRVSPGFGEADREIEKSGDARVDDAVMAMIAAPADGEDTFGNKTLKLVAACLG